MYEQNKCQTWKERGDCITNERWMKSHCKSTCNFCGDISDRPEGKFFFMFSSYHFYIMKSRYPSAFPFYPRCISLSSPPPHTHSNTYFCFNKLVTPYSPTHILTAAWAMQPRAPHGFSPSGSNLSSVRHAQGPFVQSGAQILGLILSRICDVTEKQHCGSDYEYILHTSPAFSFLTDFSQQDMVLWCRRSLSLSEP